MQHSAHPSAPAPGGVGWVESRGGSTEFFGPSFCLGGFAGVVLLALTAPGLRTVAEPGHQWLDGCCRDPDLSLPGWAVPPLRSLGPGSLSLGYIRSRRCRSGWGRLGGWTPARGASGAGPPGGAGLRSLLPPVLCSVARLSPSPPYCAKPAPLEPAAVVAPGASTGQKPLSPRLQVGRALGTPPPAARGRFPVCETAGKSGLARLTQCWPADVTTGPSPCHTSLVAG